MGWILTGTYTPREGRARTVKVEYLTPMEQRRRRAASQLLGDREVCALLELEAFVGSYHGATPTSRTYPASMDDPAAMFWAAKDMLAVKAVEGVDVPKTEPLPLGEIA